MIPGFIIWGVGVIAALYCLHRKDHRGAFIAASISGLGIMYAHIEILDARIDAIERATAPELLGGPV